MCQNILKREILYVLIKKKGPIKKQEQNSILKVQFKFV